MTWKGLILAWNVIMKFNQHLIQYQMMYKLFIFESFKFWVTMAVPMWPDAQMRKIQTTPK